MGQLEEQLNENEEELELEESEEELEEKMTPGGSTDKKKKDSDYSGTSTRKKVGSSGKGDMLPEEEEDEDDDEDDDEDEDEAEDDESMNEAKMKDSEVLAAAKKLAKNGKDKKTKDFGKGLVDYYEKNDSFTPDQVSGLQNIMKNASFQLAKEDSEDLLSDLQSRLSEMNEEELQELSNIINDPIESSVAKVSKKVDTLVSANEETEEEADNSLSNLIEADETLSEDFKNKATTIFEAAVSEKVEKEVELIREKYDENIREAINEQYETMVEKVDNYLTYAVETLIEENDESISNKLRTEISESFIESLKGVFEKHYIEMPDGKIDIYEDLSGKARELEEMAEQQSEQIEDLSETVEELQREKIIREESEDLYDTEASRLEKLVKNLEFESVDNFKEKVSLIKETYFGQEQNGKREDKKRERNLSEKTVSVTRQIEEEEDDIENNSEMGKYIKAISRQVK